MKPCRLRPQARDDRRNEVRHYRQQAGAQVALQLVDALDKALSELQRHPAIGSPTLGQEIDLPGMRTWRITGFPLTFWYFERQDHIDITRLVGQRQDALALNIDPAT